MPPADQVIRQVDRRAGVPDDQLVADRAVRQFRAQKQADKGGEHHPHDRGHGKKVEFQRTLDPHAGHFPGRAGGVPDRKGRHRQHTGQHPPEDPVMAQAFPVGTKQVMAK